MTGVGPPRRRGNGLPAEKFVPLADVEPRLGEHLLDLLRFADIAAFLEPPGDPRAARRPGVGMVQRLYVEHGKRAEARDVVQAAAQEAGIPRSEPGASPDAPMPGSAGWSSMRESSNPDDPLAGIDTDAEFAALIAGWDRPPPRRTEAPRPRADDDGAAADQVDEPVDEHADAAHHDTAHDTAHDDPHDTAHDAAHDAALAEMAALDGTPVPAPPDDPDALEDEEHYEPPAPPPLPVPEPATLGAAAVFLAGILVVAKGGWFGLSGDVSFPLGIVLVLAGFVLFVLRLRDASGDEDDDEDGPDDDGARI